jgi:hypothetical protein
MGIGTCTDTDIVIPNTYNGLVVKSIYTEAFYGCSSITSIEIPDSVTSIGDEAFYDCFFLSNIVIPKSVVSIGEKAFYLCDSIWTIRFNGTVEQWKSIEKNSKWNSFAGQPGTKVICSDGKVNFK